MNKQDAINILAEEDVNKIITEIKEHNFKIVYWNNEYVTESERWFINDNNIYDFLSYYLDLNLHWTKLLKPLTDKFKADEMYIHKEYLFLDKE